MRSQLRATLFFATLIGVALTFGWIGAESHAEKTVADTISAFEVKDFIPAGPTGHDPTEDELFPLRPYQLIPKLEGQVAYGEVEKAPVLDQPIEYSHMLHAGELQIACEYCHTGARRSIHAGIPETETCMNCHKAIDSEGRPELEKLVAFYESDEPIPWQKVHDLPDFVHFSHKRHVRGGVACQECHGEVQNEMTVAYRVNTLQMGWCLNCHRDHPKVDENYGANAELRRAELKDCLTCHK